MTTSTLSAQSVSTTSSGSADGLGRRVLAFDREEGTMLERLVVRPELGAFENMLRERLDRVAALEDERIARPRTIERDADGSLVVISEFVPGSRLSELLDICADLGAAPGVDAGLGFMLDILPALCGLHAGTGFAHGTIAPARTVLTPAGQIVLLDAIYGGALAHVRYSRHKLWREFGVAARPSAGSPRLDLNTDITQAALAAVMIVLGRPLRDDEYPNGLTSVIAEVVESAQIRASATFAAGLQEFLERALPLAHARPYTAADDALFDVRTLAAELGIQICRRALVEFIEQMETGGHSGSAAPLDEYAAAAEEQLSDDAESGMPTAADEQDLVSGVDAEISLDSLVEDSPYDLHEATQIDVQAASFLETRAPSSAEAFETPAPAPHVIAAVPAAVDAEVVGSHVDVVSAAVEATPIAAGVEPREAAAVHESTHDTTDLGQPEDPAEVPSVRSRRAKRPVRSVRARKDKLRSLSSTDKPAIVQPSVAVAAAPAAPVQIETPAPPLAPAPAPTPVPQKTNSWLVPPERAAAFESPVPDIPATPVPPPVLLASPAPPVAISAPTVPVYAPPPVPAYPSPVAPPQAAPAIEPVFSRTVSHVPPVAPSYPPVPPLTPAAATPSIAVASPQVVSLKLKEEPRRPRAARPVDTASEIYSAPISPTIVTATEPSRFPWKLAAAAVVIMVGAIVGGKIYLPANGIPTEEPAEAATATTARTPAASTTAAPMSSAAQTGRLEIETQPAGAHILIDGKPAGESPLTLDGVSPGRHVVTFVSSSGSVRRTVRVEAGRVAKLDVPIFSGWVGVYAPFVVEVSEAGQVIGSTEEPRLMLNPGKHALTLTNRELGYSSQHSVDVEPGEERAIRIDPHGKANFNATPWAEVWIDGRKAGDTPIANLQMPLGIREVVFRNPDFGERRVTVTIKANAPVAVSVDMSRPGR